MMMKMTMNMMKKMLYLLLDASAASAEDGGEGRCQGINTSWIFFIIIIIIGLITNIIIIISLMVWLQLSS